MHRGFAGRRRWWVGIAALIVAGLVAGPFVAGPFGGPPRAGTSGDGGTHGAPGSSRSSAPAPSSSVAALPPGAENAASGVAQATAGAAAPAPASVASGPGTGGLPDEVPPVRTRVIKTGTVTLQVPTGGLNDAMARVSQQASAAGGFVAGSSLQTPADSTPPSGSLTVRVPAPGFEAFVAYLQRQGKVLGLTTTGQDVTSSYVDLQARITALEGTRTQFEQVLARATTIGDILAVETQISDLETQIEQLQGQFNVLDNQTAYSTVTVNLSEKAAVGRTVEPHRPPGGLEMSWLHARHSFAHGVEEVIGATGGIAVFLLFAALLGLTGRWGWRAGRRRWAP